MRSLWPCLVSALIPILAGQPQPQLMLLATLEGSRPTPFASNIALSPDGKFLASNTDGMVKLWDVERRRWDETDRWPFFSFALRVVANA
jgi:WD40 repeat protein